MRIMHIIDGRETYEDIKSLEKLANCSLKHIEESSFYKKIFLENNKDIYRLNSMVYQALKQEYLESNKQNKQINSFIKSIDASLNSQS